MNFTCLFVSSYIQLTDVASECKCDLDKSVLDVLFPCESSVRLSYFISWLCILHLTSY